MSAAPRLVLGCALLLAAAVLLTVAVLGARGRLRRNPWAGVRTSRTLASDEAFTVANRVAAAPLGAAGLVALLGGVSLIVGGPGAVVWTVLLVATAGMLGLTGLGGAVLTVAQLGIFKEGVTAGRGWIAVALVIFGRWNPLLVLGGAFLFGFTDALQIRVQAVSGGITSSVPTEIFTAAPYAVTLAVMVAATVWAGRDAQPSALGAPFRKGVSA